MKVFAVLRESVKVYFKNFADLMGAFLVEAVLWGMCFAPLMFLMHPDTKVLAWLCVPMWLLIALPARQNYAIALQDMLHGGRVLSPRLVSLEGYGRKLGRGLVGLVKMLMWLAIPVAAVLLMVEIYIGKGCLATTMVGFWGFERLDGISMLNWFKNFDFLAETPKAVDGLINLIMIVAGTFILPVIGCAVHCGGRHVAALEEKKLLRGKRLAMMALWVLGFLFFLPFAAVVLGTLFADLKVFVKALAEAFMTKKLSVPALGEKLYIIGGAFVLLFLPVVPLKQLIPAVAVHQQARKNYGELKTDAAA